MNNQFKSKLRELLNVVKYPAFAYGYESNKIVAINELGKKIIGNKVKNIKELSIDKIRPKYVKEVLENGAGVFLEVELHNGKNRIYIDEEVSCIKIEELHLCVVFFQHVYLQNFDTNLSVCVPRVIWKDENGAIVGYSSNVKNDIDLDVVTDIFDKDQDLNKILDAEEVEDISRYNVVNMIRGLDGEAFFAKTHRIPIIARNDRSIGSIEVYEIIVGEEIYDSYITEILKREYDIKNKKQMKFDFAEKIMEIYEKYTDTRTIIEGIFMQLYRFCDIRQVRISTFDFISKQIECRCDWRADEHQNAYPRKTHYYFTEQNILEKEIRKNNGVAIFNPNTSNRAFERIICDTDLKAVMLFPFAIEDSFHTYITYGHYDEERIWEKEEVTVLKFATRLLKIAVIEFFSNKTHEWFEKG